MHVTRRPPGGKHLEEETGNVFILCMCMRVCVRANVYESQKIPMNSTGSATKNAEACASASQLFPPLLQQQTLFTLYKDT